MGIETLVIIFVVVLLALILIGAVLGKLTFQDAIKWLVVVAIIAILVLVLLRFV